MLSSRPIQLNLDAPLHNSTRTPGRALKNRAENAHVAMTVNAKGKGAASRTPFQPATLQPKRLFSAAQKPTIVTTRPARPLGDKTPFPNRVGTHFHTPLPEASNKLAKLALEPPVEGNTPGSAQRPSSTRKHVRAPGSVGKNFETPVNQGNHWDVSDGSIAVSEVLAQEPIVEDDFDEIEYMPPNTMDLAYRPPFDFELPDYKVVGKSLFDFAHAYPFDDSPPSVIEMDENPLVSLDTEMAVSELETDDPFQQIKTLPKPASSTRLPSASRTALKPVPNARIATRPLTRAPSVASSRAAPALKTRTNSLISRPGTSASAAATSRLAQKPTGAQTVVAKPASKVAGAAQRLKNATTPRNVSAVKTSMSTATVSGPPRGMAAAGTGISGIRRPVTSAAVYNKPVARVGAAAASSVPSSRLSRTLVGAKSPAVKEDLDVLVVGGGGVFEEDDFRFEV